MNEQQQAVAIVHVVERVSSALRELRDPDVNPVGVGRRGWECEACAAIHGPGTWVLHREPTPRAPVGAVHCNACGTWTQCFASGEMPWVE